ncbi:hypothetical protein OF83DRAFT_1169245 [Amylostereum chailletii]|nr:hypothetical protein OF83DRAFT_1169245 [Amylostereum chailletii]
MTATLSGHHPSILQPDQAFATDLSLQQQTQDAFESPSDVGSDPAQSLRQAALLTLRNNKRRKPATSLADASITGLPTRPTLAAAPTIQLDYGQGDSSTPVSTSEPSPTNGPVNPLKSPPPVNRSEPTPSKDEDVSMREEGEISESEEEPPPPAPPAPKPAAYGKTPFVKPSSPPAVANPSRLLPAPVMATKKDKPNGAIDMRPIARLPHRPSLSESVPASPNAAKPEQTKMGPPYVLDSGHVRPGLTLTQEQYNTVKDITLDLLGWGVPPEYLLECGLSREIVYYVFTELNLRLPANLDTSGIPPYPPSLDQLQALLQVSEIINLSAPSPVSRPADPQPNPTAASAIPPNPIPQGSTPTLLHRLSAVAEPFVSQVSSSNDDQRDLPADNLVAMEQQRRQELLARKAVQASRKRKDAPAPASGGPSFVPPEAIGKALVPESSVDDFLSSIGPASIAIKKELGAPFVPSVSSIITSNPHVLSPEPMDVDDDIPGLSRGNSFAEYPPTSHPPISVATTDPVLPSSAQVASPSQQSPTNLPIPTTVDSILAQDELQRTGNIDTVMSNVPLAESSGSTTPDSQPVAQLTRRGTKRPVAADFVDLDSSYNGTTAGIQRTNSAGYVSNGHHPNPHVRRRMTASSVGGFANITNTRRCVIDVSDSEDEDGEDQEVEDALVVEQQPVTPAATAPEKLVDVEQAIVRMKKEIQEKMDLIRKKQLTSGRSTPLGPPVLQPTPLSAPIKQEVEEPALENAGSGEGDVTMRAESVSTNAFLRTPSEAFERRPDLITSYTSLSPGPLLCAPTPTILFLVVQATREPGVITTWSRPEDFTDRSLTLSSYACGHTLTSIGFHSYFFCRPPPN